MKLLFAPLQRLANLMEGQVAESKQLRSVLTLSIEDASKAQISELQIQTSLLEDIKGILKMQMTQNAVSSKGSGKPGLLGGIKDKMPKFKGAKSVAVAVGLFAGAILASTVFFALMPTLSVRTLLTTMAVAGIMTLIVPRFMELTKLYRFKMKNILKAAAILPIISMAILASALPLMLMPAISPMALISAFFIGAALTLFAPTFIKLVQGLKGTKLKDQISAVAAMAIMAGGIVAVALVFALLGSVSGWSAPPLWWTITAGLAMFLFSLAFVQILKTIKGRSVKEIAFAGLAVPVMAAAIVGVAYIFKLFPKEAVAPGLGWTIKAGLAIFLFSLGFVQVLKAINGRSLKDIVFASLAVPMMAAAIVGVAFIFQALSFVEGYEKFAPDPIWSLKSGLAMLAFTVPYLLISLAAKRIGAKGLVLGALAMIAVAGAILASAWIFSVLPDTFIAPPMDWAIGAAIAITAFTIPLAIVGLLATVLTPVTLLLGAAGIILIAGTMWVVAWIFSKLPDLSAISKNITDAIMYPVDSMINALGRFKNEIGIENMVPLAGGILAIAGSWLVLTAAMAGQGIGGAIGAIGNAIGEGINKLTEWFGGKKAMGPKDLLELLINKADGLRKIARPMKNIGMGFKGIGLHAASVQRALGALIPFTQEDEVEELSSAAASIMMLAGGYRSIAASTKLMNIDALNASASMFNAIARVAESDGEDLITKISEDLMEAVRQLSETVKNLEASNSQNSESMGDSISSTLTGFIDKIRGKKDEAGGSSESGLVDMSAVISAIQELEGRFDRPIKVKEI